jgi:hypothetical protein
VEIFVIAFFDLTDNTKGYNKTTGGSKGYRHSKESRIKMSELQKGEKHPNFGKTLPEETRVKMSIVRFGKTHTKEARAKISIAHIGKTHTEVSCAKMSKKKKGGRNHNSKPICVFGKLYDAASTASDTLREVCYTTTNGNFMAKWAKRKKHQHNVFYVSKEFYKEMKDTTDIITHDMYEKWTVSL